MPEKFSKVFKRTVAYKSARMIIKQTAGILLLLQKKVKQIIKLDFIFKDAFPNPSNTHI